MTHSAHGITIQTGITCNKILCYMDDSAWRWSIVKKPKVFWSYAKHFWIIPGARNCKILSSLSK